MNPFVSVKIGETDVTEMVTRFSFDDSMDKDNVLKLTLQAGSLIEAEPFNLFESGMRIKFFYGYKEGLQSAVEEVRLTDIKVRYGGNITCNITGLDVGTVVKRSTRGKVWKNITTSDILREIASTYNLEVVADYPGRLWSSIVQGTLSDFEFIEDLQLKEHEGSFIIYIRSNKLYFVKRGLGLASAKSFSVGSGEVVSFDPTQKETQRKAESVAVAGKAPKEDADGEGDNIGLGKFGIVYNENAEIVGAEIVGKRLVTPHRDKETNANVTKSAKKSGSTGAITANMVVVGNPSILPNTIITVLNVLTKHLGNYLVVDVNHSITSSFLTTMSLKKNAGIVPSRQEETKTNDTVGKEVSDDSVEINVYDENANLIRTEGGKDYTEPN